MEHSHNDYTQLQGIIDLHIHSAPDVRQRSHTDLELAEQARQVGARAMVVKSHQFPTMERGWLVSQMYPEVQVFGSITLNRYVGGIHPLAVKTAIQLGAKCVWLPTIHAANHRVHEGKHDGIEVVKDGKISPELIEIMQLIAEHNIILATGHLSAAEIWKVAEAARKHGVQKLVVTHPEFNMIRLSIEEQRQMAAQYGVLFERTYAQPLGGGKYHLNLEDNLRAIERIGHESTIISTDSGQIENPLWKDALAEYVGYMQQNGISEQAIQQMTRQTPAWLLGI